MPDTERSIFERLKNSAQNDGGEENKYDFFEHLGKNAYWFLLALIGLLVLLCFRDYIFSDKFYVFKGIGTDSLDALYPYVYNSAEFFAKHNLPSWSFNYGMGQNTFPFFLRDPFDIFLYLAGKDSILNGIVYLEILKILLTGLIFFFYLKTLKFTNLTSITGSLFYSFCSYMIIGGVWHFFSFEVLNMALMLLAFEQLLTRDKWLMYPLPFFFIGLTMPLNLYFYGLFMACYALLRLVQTKRLTIKITCSLFLKMTGLALVGLLLSGPFFLENMGLLFRNPRVGGNNSYAHILFSSPIHAHSTILPMGTYMLRLFSNDLLGTPIFFSGQRNTFEAPMFYCGLPCLLLMPQLFPFLEKKTRIFFIVFISAWFLPVIFPWFRYAFWLFCGNYFRVYSFFVSFVFIYFSISALDLIIRHKKINLKLLTGTTVVLAILLYFPYFSRHNINTLHEVLPERIAYIDLTGRNIINRELQGFILLMLITYSCLFYLLARKNSEPYIKTIFLVVILFELYHLTDSTVNGWDALTVSELKQKQGYNDYTFDAVNYLRQKDSSFYRIDKNYFSSLSRYNSLNDGLIQDYHGTSSYGSFNQLYYINYLQLMGLSDKKKESESRWSKGLRLQPVPESENRVKYFLVKKTISPEWYLAGDSIATFGDVTIFRNKMVLPFGFTYNKFIKESDFSQLSNYQKVCTGIKACVVQDTFQGKGLKQLTPDDIPANNVSDSNITVNEINLLKNEMENLVKDTLALKKNNETFFAGNITTAEDKIMYLSIPYDNGWHLNIDGHPAQKLILTGGMTGVMLIKGSHAIAIQYELQFINAGIMLSLAGVILYAIIWFYQRKKRSYILK